MPVYLRKSSAFPQFAREDRGYAVGFSGLLLAGYSEGKQTGDAASLATYKKLAGNLIQMVPKTDPENLRLENGQILMK